MMNYRFRGFSVDQKMEELLAVIQASRNPEQQEEATQIVEEQSFVPEFYTTLHAIITDSGLPKLDRQQACNFLTRYASVRWNKIPSELLIEMIPSLLVIAGETQYLSGEIEKYVNETVEKVIDDASDYIVTTIGELFSSGHIRAGLTLVKAVYKQIRNPKESMIDFHVSFTETVLPILMETLEGLDPVNSDHLFHCLSRMFSKEDRSYYEENLPSCLEALPVLLAAVEELFPVVIEHRNPAYATQILKFMRNAAPILGENIQNDDVVGIYLAVIQAALSHGNNRQMALGVGVLRMVVVTCGFWSLLDDNIDSFMDLLPQIFVLNEQELLNFAENRVVFVAENHKFSDNFEDAKAAASSFLLQVSLRGKSVAAEAVMECTLGVIEKYKEDPENIDNQNLVFAACQMLSTVAENVDLGPFIAAMGTLFESPSSLVRAAGFMVFKGCREVPYDQGLMQACFDNIQEEDAIVYYAAILLARIIRYEDHHDEIQEVLPNDFHAIYDMYSTLIQEFREDDLFSAFTTIAKFYGPLIVSCAVDVYSSILQFCTESITSGDGESFITSDPLKVIIQVIAEHDNQEEVMTIFEAVYDQTFEAYQVPDMSTSAFGDDLIMILSYIVKHSPVFNEKYWQFMNFIPEDLNEDFLSNWSTHFEQMIYYDKDLKAREEIVQGLCEMIQGVLAGVDEDSDLESIGDIIAAFVMAMGVDTPILQDLMAFMAEKPNRDLTDAFSAMIIQCGASVVEEFANLQDMVILWVENALTSKYPLFVAAGVVVMESVEDSELKAEILDACISIIKNAESNEEEEEEEDQIEDDMLNPDCYECGKSDLRIFDVENPKWFNDKEIEDLKQKLAQFME